MYQRCFTDASCLLSLKQAPATLPLQSLLRVSICQLRHLAFSLTDKEKRKAQEIGCFQTIQVKIHTWFPKLIKEVKPKK